MPDGSVACGWSHVTVVEVSPGLRFTVIGPGQKVTMGLTVSTNWSKENHKGILAPAHQNYTLKKHIKTSAWSFCQKGLSSLPCSFFSADWGLGRGWGCYYYCCYTSVKAESNRCTHKFKANVFTNVQKAIPVHTSWKLTGCCDYNIKETESLVFWCIGKYILNCSCSYLEIRPWLKIWCGSNLRIIDSHWDLPWNSGTQISSWDIDNNWLKRAKKDIRWSDISWKTST